MLSDKGTGNPSYVLNIILLLPFLQYVKDQSVAGLHEPVSHFLQAAHN